MTGMPGAPAGEEKAGQLAGPVQIRDATEAWPVARSAELCRAAIVTVRADQVQMPDGSVVSREVVQHPGAVAVLALDEAERVLLIRQYRHPVGRQLWELPAGLRDVAGEPPRVTAERELLEEAGYRAGDWRVLVDFFTSPGISTERLRVYLARNLTEIPQQQRKYVREDEEAYLVPAWVPLDEAVALFLSGDLHNGVTAVGILSAYAARGDSFSALRGPDAPER
jgi:8-oxo-dGTP pyrophosphatase MutT (NUDIX family)